MSLADDLGLAQEPRQSFSGRTFLRTTTGILTFVGTSDLFFWYRSFVPSIGTIPLRMGRIDKTVFLSYRRTNIPWAIAINENLTKHGYDVFFDYEGIGSGDFESIILENIKARAHFLIVLTPSALDRCADPKDWLRREIETALDTKRNIVPLILEGFDFGSPGIAKQLTGRLEAVKHYNALLIPSAYFKAAMERLRDQFLNVSLDHVPHPISPAAREVVKEQQAAAATAPPVEEKELTAQEYFERGIDTAHNDEKIRFYSQAIGLKPNYAAAFNNRGVAQDEKGNLDEALQDYTEAIRFEPSLAIAFNNRGLARHDKGDYNGALQDFDEALRLKPDYANAFEYRGLVREAKGDLEGAREDFNEATRLKKAITSAMETHIQEASKKEIVRYGRGELIRQVVEIERKLK